VTDAPVTLGTFARRARRGDRFVTPDGKAHAFRADLGERGVEVAVRPAGCAVVVTEVWHPRVLVRPAPQGYRRKTGGQRRRPVGSKRPPEPVACPSCTPWPCAYQEHARGTGTDDD